MLNRFNLIKSVGQFDHVAVGQNLSRLTLFYAENGRGKTTLASILRSLSTNSGSEIEERTRLGAIDPPHVVIDCMGGPPATAVFQNGTWNRNHPNLRVFDDFFVGSNICSGLEVTADHRGNLHEFILGDQGVALHKRHQQLIEDVEAHNPIIRQKASVIEKQIQVPLEAFLPLAKFEDVDERISEMEKRIAAAKESEPIRTARGFSPLLLPHIAIQALQELLSRDVESLNESVARQVAEHINHLGRGAEAWLAEGLGRTHSDNNCPFCAQDLKQSPLFARYKAFFSSEYRNLKSDIGNVTAEFSRIHGESASGQFQASFREIEETQSFWSPFCELPKNSLNISEIVAAWRVTRDSVLGILNAKQAAPLEKLELPNAVADAISHYENLRGQLATQNTKWQNANSSIDKIRAESAAANVRSLLADLATLRLHKLRHEADMIRLCKEYLAERAAKEQAELVRDEARDSLRTYRTTVFPQYEQSINQFLIAFNANFRLGNVEAPERRGGPKCTYNVLVDNFPVPVDGGAIQSGVPTFKTTLSAGDRNTLALSIFFASIERNQNKHTCCVVIDDPITSFDEHRSLHTVHEVRKLVSDVSQVIVLSHRKSFLCELAHHPDPTLVTALHIKRSPIGSTIAQWNINEHNVSEYDIRHKLLREFLIGTASNAREVATALRPLLEGFCRVAYPEHFKSGDLLGPFRQQCLNRVGQPGELLNASQCVEFGRLIDFGNRFHHDTNPNASVELVNDALLTDFVKRALAFTRK